MLLTESNARSYDRTEHPFDSQLPEPCTRQSELLKVDAPTLREISWTKKYGKPIGICKSVKGFSNIKLVMLFYFFGRALVFLGPSGLGKGTVRGSWYTMALPGALSS